MAWYSVKHWDKLTFIFTLPKDWTPIVWLQSWRWRTYGRPKRWYPTTTQPRKPWILPSLRWGLQTSQQSSDLCSDILFL